MRESQHDISIECVVAGLVCGHSSISDFSPE